MNNEYLKRELAAITYNDNTDIVTLRYLLLQALAQYAMAYKKVTGTAYAFKLLQQHKKLENVQTTLKEKNRNNQAAKEDFIVAKFAALECIENFTAVTAFVSAA